MATKIALFALLIWLTVISVDCKYHRNLIRNVDLSSSNETPSSIIRDFREGKSTPSLCTLCHGIVDMGKRFYSNRFAFKVLFLSVCRTFKFNETFCNNLAHLYVEPISFILSDSRLKPEEICTLTLGRCMSKEAYENSSIYLNVNISPQPIKQKDLNGSNQSTRIVWFTDIHPDLNYTVGSPAKCNEPLCCRSSSQMRDPGTYLSETSTSPLIAGKWGTKADCDLPMNAIDDMMKHLNDQQSNDTDYLLFTGDIDPHDVWNTTEDSIKSETRSLNDLMEKRLSKFKRFVPVMGNHEALPVGMFPLSRVPSKFSGNWIYKELYQQYKKWIPETEAETFKNGGYYSVDVNSNLRVIVLNTNQCSRFNFWLWYSTNQLNEQLVWLVNKLDEAENKGMFVHIAGHVPPDKHYCTWIFSENYIKIMLRYQNIIKGQFFGHTHYDEFRVFYWNELGSEPKPIGSALIGGSLTTYEYVNPCYKVIHFGNNGSMTDIETYFTDIDRANQRDSDHLIWEKLYSTKNDFGMTDHSPEEFSEIFSRLMRNSTFFDRFYQFYHRFGDVERWPKPCIGQCRSDILESIAVYNGEYV